MDFREAIELGLDCTGGIELFVFWVDRPLVCLMSFRRVMSLFFEVGGGVLGEHFVGVGIL